MHLLIIHLQVLVAIKTNNKAKQAGSKYFMYIIQG